MKYWGQTCLVPNKRVWFQQNLKQLNPHIFRHTFAIFSLSNGFGPHQTCLVGTKQVWPPPNGFGHHQTALARCLMFQAEKHDLRKNSWRTFDRHPKSPCSAILVVLAQKMKKLWPLVNHPALYKIYGDHFAFIYFS